MNTSIQIQSRGEQQEALATALGHAVLKFLTFKINALLALCALISVMCWLIDGGGATAHGTATWCCAWVLHFAVMAIIDIAKGGARL